MVNIYIELMVGLLGVILGFITMKYKLGYLVSGVNIKKLMIMIKLRVLLEAM